MSAWRNQYVHVNQYSRPGMKLKEVRKLIVHWTANPGASAANHFGYFDRSIVALRRYASAHIFIDKKEAICIVPLDEVAYAAGDVQQRVNGVPYRGVAELLPSANSLSISVELCVEKDGTFAKETLDRAVDVFAELCKTYKLDPLTDIVRHYDVTHKNCPAPWVADIGEFNEFKSRVDAKLNVKPIDGTPKPTPKPTYPLPSGIIREGDKGSAVKQLQAALNAAGFKCGTADGAFGPKTKAAVKKFQAKYKLVADGIYGPKTKAKLAEVLK
jgi:N-acetylmuramoyl-L-alanine amidase